MKILNIADNNANNVAPDTTTNVRTVSDDGIGNVHDVVGISSENIGEYAKSVEMTEYEKAVTRSFDEAREEERKIAEDEAAKAKAAVDAASTVDVGSHVEKDDILKSVSAPVIDKTVKISQEHKDAFLNALIENGRYTETFSLFSGRVTCTIRSRTLEETDSIEAYLRYLVGIGRIRTSSDYANEARKILLTAQVQKMNGVFHEELKGPMNIVEGSAGVELPGWEKQLDWWGRQPSAIAVAVVRCIAEFEARYWAMVDNAKDTNFWNRGESTAE